MLRLANGERRHAIDSLIRYAHVARFAAQPRAAAVGTREVPAVAAEEHANVDLVLLAFEPAEETADAVEFLVALDDEFLLGVGQLRPRHIETDPGFARSTLQFGLLRPVVRLAPRLDGALLNRLRGIGHDEIHVELDDVAEAVTCRAGTERVVEREQARLRIFVRDAAVPALEPLGELMHPRAVERPRRAAAFDVRRFDRIGEPLSQLLSVQLHAIHDHLQHRPIGERGRIDVLQRDGAIAVQHASETLPAQRLERGGDSFVALGLRRTCGERIVVLAVGVGHFGRLVHFRTVHSGRRGVDDRQVETDDQPRTRRQIGELRGDDLGGFAHDLAAALTAERAAHARVEQAHVVVNFRCRADGRARVPDAVLLPNGDGGRDAVDPIDVRLLHPFEKLAGVGRQRLHVTALPFGVDRVESERRLTRSADTGDDDQRPGWQRQVDVLEIVRARAAHDEIGRGLCRRRRGCVHSQLSWETAKQ